MSKSSKNIPLYDDDEVDEDGRPESVSMEALIAALYESEAGDGELNETICYGLSEISAVDFEALHPAWEKLDVGFRQRILGELSEIAEFAYDVDYTALGQFLISAPQPEIRAEAIGLLSTDYSDEQVQRLMAIVRDDQALTVRCAAMAALGEFILTAELAGAGNTHADAALALAEATYLDPEQPTILRGYALEALANSSTDNLNMLIADAYASNDARLQISAVTAMGNSCDEVWKPQVLENLRHTDPDMRAAAARAAGDLPVPDALSSLGRLIDDEDRAVEEAAIYALGEIGGDGAVRLLERRLAQAEEDEDERLIDLIDDAITTASMGGGSLMMFRLDD